MKYRALLYNDPKDLEFAELDMPECGDNDVILKNRMASICGSDTDTWLNGGEMHYIPPHVEFGHEVVSEIYAVGKNVKDIKVGDRVAPFPLKVTPNSRKAGWLGGFSEYIYCTNAAYDYNLWKLEDSISDKEAAMIEPFSVGITTADKAVLREGATYLILGCGLIGFCVAARLADKGVPRKNITLIDKSELRLQKAREQGFNGVCNAGNDNFWDKVFEYTGKAYSVYGPGSNADYIFECAGSMFPDANEPTLMEQAMKVLKYNGTMVVTGVHRQQVNINMQKLVFGLQNIVYGSGNVEYHFKEAIRILQSKQFNFEALVTQVYSFEDAIEAIKFTCDPSKCFRVLISYNS